MLLEDVAIRAGPVKYRTVLHPSLQWTVVQMLE